MQALTEVVKAQLYPTSDSAAIEARVTEAIETWLWELVDKMEEDGYEDAAEMIRETL